jgi:uncharacterized protein (TIGR02145 family)
MKKNILAILLMIALAITTNSHAQVGIGVATANINPSAQLEVVSTAKGFLPPRMTEAQRNAIVVTAASAGLIVYCTDCSWYGEWQGYNGSSWTNMLGGSVSPIYVILPSIAIGTQIWTTQNLEVTTYRNGDAIPQITNATEWANATEGAWCYYDNDPANAAIYGKLYNWYAVNDSRGLAPAGYHIPSNAERIILTNFLGGTAGTQLKATTGWPTAGLPYSGNGSNSSGFTALPGGVRYQFNGSFDQIGRETNFWTVTASVSSAWLLNLHWDTYINAGMNDKGNGNSIRCIRD